MRNVNLRRGGDYFAEGFYFQTNVETGVITNRVGRRMVGLTDDFLKGFYAALQEECGPASDEVLFLCGKSVGQMVGRRLQKELADYYGEKLEDFTVAHLHACLRSFFSHHGWGKVALNFDNGHEGLIVAEVENAIFNGVLGPADAPRESLLAGFLGGICSELFGQQLDCVQTECQSCGAEKSLFVMGLESRLGDVRQWVEEKVSHSEIVSRLGQVSVV